jgi:hypothetical protein
MLEKTVKP